MNGANDRGPLLAVALALLATTGAVAQTPAPWSADTLATLGLHVVQPMNPEQTAAMRAEVDAALARDHATDAFENITDANGGRVRHKASGLKCPLGNPGQIVEAGPEGDVLCRTSQGGSVYQTRLRRAAPGADLKSVFEAASRGAQNEPGFTPFQGQAIEARPRPGSGLPDHHTLRYYRDLNGQTVYVREAVGVIDGWVLVELSAVPKPAQPLPSTSEMIAEATFGSQLRPPPEHLSK